MEDHHAAELEFVSLPQRPALCGRKGACAKQPEERDEHPHGEDHKDHREESDNPRRNHGSTSSSTAWEERGK